MGSTSSMLEGLRTLKEKYSIQMEGQRMEATMISIGTTSPHLKKPQWAPQARSKPN
jgi:hypothetical protein